MKEDILSKVILTLINQLDFAHPLIVTSITKQYQSLQENQVRYTLNNKDAPIGDPI